MSACTALAIVSLPPDATDAGGPCSGSPALVCADGVPVSKGAGLPCRNPDSWMGPDLQLFRVSLSPPPYSEWPFLLSPRPSPSVPMGGWHDACMDCCIKLAAPVTPFPP